MMDVSNDMLSEALGFMRITGSLLLVESYSPPWGIAIPDQASLEQLLQVDRNTQVVAFHFVQRGWLVLARDNYERKAVNTGDVLVCFGGQAHTIFQGTPSSTVALEAYLKGSRHWLHPKT